MNINSCAPVALEAKRGLSEPAGRMHCFLGALSESESNTRRDEKNKQTGIEVRFEVSEDEMGPGFAFSSPQVS